MNKSFRNLCLGMLFTSSLLSASEIDVNNIRMIDGREKTPMEYLHDDTRLEPTKVFDNVYCIGSVSVVAWAVNTSEGIVLIDAMWDDKDGQAIEDGLKKFGLNPADIKYIIITHGHGDHYGGANYLREKYGAKTFLTKVDTDLMYNLNTGANSPRSPKTKIDILVKDHDKIVLGDTEFTILETPGHTPGGLSLMFPVKDGDKEYTAVLWGGTGVPRDRESQLNYKKSAEYFSRVATENGAQVALTAHLFLDQGYEKLAMISQLKKGEKNPFILNKDEMKSYLNSLIKNADDALKNSK